MSWELANALPSGILLHRLPLSELFKFVEARKSAGSLRYLASGTVGVWLAAGTLGILFRGVA